MRETSPTAAGRDRRPVGGENPLRPAARAFAYTIVLLGALPLSSSVVSIVLQPPKPGWFLLAVVTVFSSVLYIRVSSVRATVSVSDGFVFASALLFGPAAATLTVCVDGLAASLRSGHRTLARLLFNVAEPAVSVWTSAQLFYWLSDSRPLFEESAAIGPLVLPIVAMTTIYFVINTTLITTAVALETGTSPQQFLREHMPHVGLNYFATACLLALLVPNSSNLGAAVLAVTVPLLVVSYASSKIAMGRIDEANQHLSKLNRVYLSMIETLAVAIDAKDQVTHGHIRRVQAQAVALARALGIDDDVEIRAIEAAGLLHDLGKLVVPEHILNKPGALTRAELEQMKSHAAIGADILGTVDLPYPVVPIVRHHHEAWDGSGYPDQLAGEAIPIGARILAVVDCFDALTSDRPYRRRLPEQDALAIITARRGRMYDPLVVDKFIEICRELPKDTGANPRDPLVASALRRPHAPQTSEALTRQAVPRVEDLEREAVGLAPALAGERSLAEIGRRLAAYSAKVIGDCVCVLYVHDAIADQLTAAYVSSDEHRSLRAVSSRLGAGISGWVAANQQPITNADATLDLGDLAAAVAPRLRTCLSVPLGSSPSVLTLYSFDPRGFSTDQARLISLAAGRVLLPTSSMYEHCSQPVTAAAGMAGDDAVRVVAQ